MLSMEQAKGSSSSFSCFLDMQELYFFSLKRTSIGMRLPCRYVCPFRYLIASSALSLFLQSTKAQNCVYYNRIVSISPSRANTSYKDSLVACRGSDPTNSLWSSCCPRPTLCSSVSSHLMLTGRLAPGMTVFLSFSMPFYASLREANLTSAEPVKSEFFLMSLTSRILPNSSKNFQMSSSFQLVGRLPTQTMSSMRLAMSSSLVATGDSDRLRGLSLGLSFSLSFFSNFSGLGALALSITNYYHNSLIIFKIHSPVHQSDLLLHIHKLPLKSVANSPAPTQVGMSSQWPVGGYQWAMKSQLKIIVLIMSAMKLWFSLALLGFLLHLGSPYAIQGLWLSDAYPDAAITVSDYTTNLDGTNVYLLAVNSCQFTYQIQIDESFVSVLNLGAKKGSNNCSQANSSALAQQLEQKIFYFYIAYNKLGFVTVFGNKTTTFTRQNKTVVADLSGQYQDVVTGQTVIFSNNTVFVCGRALQGGYLTDTANFELNISSVVNKNCQSKGTAQRVFQLLGQANYYRVQNQNSLIFYNDAKPTLRLKYVQKVVDPTPPPKQQTNSTPTTPTPIAPTTPTTPTNATATTPTTPTAATTPGPQQISPTVPTQPTNSINQNADTNNQASLSNTSTNNQNSANIPSTQPNSTIVPNQPSTTNTTPPQNATPASNTVPITPTSPSNPPPSTAALSNPSSSVIPSDPSSASTAVASNPPSSTVGPSTPGPSNVAAITPVPISPAPINPSPSNVAPATSISSTSVTTSDSSSNASSQSSSSSTSSTSTSTSTSNSTSSSDSNSASTSTSSSNSTSSSSSSATSSSSTSATSSSSSSVTPSISIQNKSASLSLARQPYTGVVIQNTNLIGLWNTEYFNSGSSEVWPSRLKFNGTYVVVQGCNTFSIPIKINFSSEKVVTQPSGIISTKKACGDSDQPFIDAINNANSFESVGNSTSILLNFFDSKANLLFSVSRNYTAAEKPTIQFLTAAAPLNATVLPTTSPSVTPAADSVPPSPAPANNPVAASTSTNTSTAATSSPASTLSTTSAASASSSTPSTTSSSSATTSDSSSTTSNTASSTPSVSSASSNSSTSPSVSASSNSSSSAANSASNIDNSTLGSVQLVGKYHPVSISQFKLPAAQSQLYTYSFSLNSVSVSGTCNSYKLAYSVQQQGNSSLLLVDQGSQIQQPTGRSCDVTEDALYLRFLTQSRSYKLSSGNGQTSLTLYDGAGKVAAELQKVVVSP